MLLDAHGGFAPAAASMRLPEFSAQLSSLAIGSGASLMHVPSSPLHSGGLRGKGAGAWGAARSTAVPPFLLAADGGPAPCQMCPLPSRPAAGPQGLGSGGTSGTASLRLPLEQSLMLSRLNLLTGADVSMVLPAHPSGDGQANVSVRPGQLPSLAPADLVSSANAAGALSATPTTSGEEESSAAEAELVAELAGEAADEFSRPTSRTTTPAGQRLAEVSQQLVNIAAR